MPPIEHCQVVPEAPHRISFRIADREVLKWNFGTDYPRPFFYPVVGPSGMSLTRMGHPGAPDHDHHQSVWFAHHKVLGIDFWGYTATATVRQKHWLALDDGATSCRMAVELDWFDGHDAAPLLTQQLICEVTPVGDAGEFSLELQSRFMPAAATLEFGRTNFGFLAVRVARSLSAHFGGGVLTGSDGRQTEADVFEQSFQWVDYSGPVVRDGSRIEGITYFDHPSNPGQPTGWHVRDDGWFCASPCMKGPLTTSHQAPLSLRYLLFVHDGGVDAARSDQVFRQFADSAPMQVVPGPRPHTRWTVGRAGKSDA